MFYLGTLQFLLSAVVGDPVLSRDFVGYIGPRRVADPLQGGGATRHTGRSIKWTAERRGGVLCDVSQLSSERPSESGECRVQMTDFGF